MKLTLYFIRHGLSCCNILHHPDIKYFAPLNTFRQDPYLSIKGVEQSKRAGQYLKNKIPKINLVLSSALIRAIETGLCMFPNNEIDIVPYICESNPSLENKPYKYLQQFDRMVEKVNKYENVNPSLQDDGLSETNFEKFIDFIVKNYDLKDKNIAVITHSNFLMKIFDIKERMNNNAVYEVIIDTDTYKIESRKTIFSGYQFPTNASLSMSMR